MALETAQAKSHRPAFSVGIIGAGIIGLSCAEELSRRGTDVCLYDTQTPGHGASWVAAGMIAPAFETLSKSGQHPKLAALCQKSAELWGGFASRLERDTGMATGYVSGPSLAVATDDSEACHLRQIAEALSGNQVEHEVLSSDEVRRMEPTVTETCRPGLLLQSDGQVDNRKVISALMNALKARPHVSFKLGASVASPEVLLDEHDAVLCTAGWQTRALSEAFEPIRPIGGQLLALERPTKAPAITIRSDHVYIVPKADRIVVGASVEPGRVLEGVDEAVLQELHDQAITICPGLAEARRLESWVGVRPGTADDGPLLGQIGERPVYVASGHYRNGILLAPITAKSMADLILADECPDLVEAFGPQRFMSQVI